MKKIWFCKIGECDEAALRAKFPRGGADGLMRAAVMLAYQQLTGEEPKFIFSGWGAELTEGERHVVDDTPIDEIIAIHNVREAAKKN